MTTGELALSSVRQWPFWSPNTLREVSDCIAQNGAYTVDTHPAIEEFEAAFSELHGGATALMCGSGTAALAATYFALGLGAGAEVLVPTWTFRATVTPLLLLGFKPVFCDVDEAGLLDLKDAAARCSRRTEAVVVTHWNGALANPRAVEEFAATRGLAVVFDASHAHSAEWSGRSVASFGDAAAFSCGTTKAISGGMAGVVASNNARTYERAIAFSQPKGRCLRQVRTSRVRRWGEVGFGTNFRATPVAAVLAQEHLGLLEVRHHLRARNFTALGELLREFFPEVCLPCRAPEASRGSWYKYQVTFDQRGKSRDRLVSLLQENGVDARIPTRPLHWFPLWNEMFGEGAVNTNVGGELPMADRLAAEVVEFPGLQLYEDGEPILHTWRRAFEKVAEGMRNAEGEN